MNAAAGRVAVVAGGGRKGSIGREVAEHLVREGYRVVASDIGGTLKTHPDYEVAPMDDLDDLAASYDPAVLITRRCDVTDEAQVKALFDDAEAEYGVVDVAVNCAGLGIGLKPVVDLELRDWQVNIDVMATGAFLFARQAARTMVAAETPGRIITIASQAGKTGVRLLAAYSAAKFAVIGLTQAMAGELGRHGITVNTVCPGTIETPLLAVEGGVYQTFSKASGRSSDDFRNRLADYIPVKRLGTPADVAHAVAYLASAEASFVTGSALNVAGGEEMH
ncbi:3-ketoacyl-ACP reductase [Nocardioides flavus (ex Wang et al. 2016)]|uniref:3-ketoacyl-ACP reductase n=1 Tax=Nocardioides flavus (ex Wang et al. 2016) TaxID=2058780 RepID=A0ABQ3HJB4_9ACTN|nr:SDR family oxidoreductase [Nocardioides flavus (ex Wang et al. 2016)]GHE16762.1 3-ketoacyl-ACP reductase [Nocardioides flavus (ex Wang et al. 2016)]